MRQKNRAPRGKRLLAQAIAVTTIAFSTAPVAADAPFATYHSASEPILNDPHDLAFGPDGLLYVADKFGHRLVVMDPETLEILSVVDEGQLPGVHDISFGPNGRAAAAVTSASAVALYDAGPNGITRTGGIGPFPNTEGALLHSNGRLYVMASGTGDLLALEGETVVAQAQGLFGAHDVAEAPDGSIWVADNRRSRLVHYTEDLEELAVLDDPVFGFIGPRYLDIDDFGRLIVADQDAHRILMIEPLDGSLTGVLGDGTPGIGPNKFDDPEGVAVRGTDYYFADSDNNRVVRYVVVVN